VTETGPRRTGLGRLLASTGAAVTSQGMATAATPLLAATLTDDPLLISVVAACAWLPWLLVGLPLGAMVDRLPARPVMVGTDLVRAALVGAFAVVVAADAANVWMLALVVFLVGVGGCLFDPAAQATIPYIVGRDRDALTRANGTIWSLDTFARSLAGPPLGAAAFVAAAELPFAAQAGLLAASGLLLIGVPSRPAGHVGGARPALRHDVAEGLRFLVATPGLRYLALAMGSFNFAFQVANSTLVLVVSQRLGLGARGFGILLAVMAVGGIVSGKFVAPIGNRLGALQVYTWAFLLQGIGWVLVVVTQSPVIASVGMAVVGFCSTAVSAVGGAARQTLTPDRLMGRVTSSTRLVGIGAAAVGAVVGGLLASVNLVMPLCTAAGLLLLTAAAFTHAPRLS
jgi:MFS family permease